VNLKTLAESHREQQRKNTKVIIKPRGAFPTG